MKFLKTIYFRIFANSIALVSKSRYFHEFPFLGSLFLVSNGMFFNLMWKTTITSISSTEINVTYQVYDRYGAGTDDATRTFLPGLPSMYWLKHNSHQFGASWNAYSSIIWRIIVNRSR